jgi:hypothetical protein
MLRRPRDPQPLGGAEQPFLEDRALGQHHAGGDLRAGHRVPDRLGIELVGVAGPDARSDAVEAEIVRDRLRTFERRPGPPEDAPGAPHVALGEGMDRIALRLVRAFVHEQETDPVALVDRSGPVHSECERDAVESNVPVDTFLDVPGPSALALAHGGEGLEVARTPVVTVARDDDRSFHRPRVTHGSPFTSTRRPPPPRAGRSRSAGRILPRVAGPSG